MRCLVTGAYGFIGSEICRALIRQGWTVVGAGRDVALGARILPGIEWIECDFNRDVKASTWLRRLANIDAVVNCVGILQSTWRDDAERIHLDSTVALFAACAAASIPRLIHISAVSADADMATGYARSKAAADAALAEIDCNWLIVKPSLVIGRGSYGGSSLLRGLAGLPCIVPLPGRAAERFQPIALDDLAEGVARLAAMQEPQRRTVHAAGPETTSVREMLVAYRAWLGFPKARELAVPLPLLNVALRLGDLAGQIGYVTSMRSTSLAQLRHDVLVDGNEFAAASGTPLKSFSETLAALPATLQDRLHARSFFIVPVLHVSLALFWILTGIVTLLPSSFAKAVNLVVDGGIPGNIAKLLVAAGCIIDIALGILFLLPRWVRRAGVAQIAVSLLYLVGLTLIAPSLWADHFGALLKVVPMIAATAVVMAFQENR